MHPRRPGAIKRFIYPDFHPFTERLEVLGPWRPFHLHPVCALMRISGMEEPLIQPAVVGKQEQAFAIQVQPPHWIDPGREREEGTQGNLPLYFGRKLADYPVRLMEDKIQQKKCT